MSQMTIRGGFPWVYNSSVTTQGTLASLPGVSTYVRIQADAPCRFYFKQAHFDADTNFVLLPTADSFQLWEGPAEISNIWMRAASAAATVEIVAFMRLN